MGCSGPKTDIGGWFSSVIILTEKHTGLPEGTDIMSKKVWISAVAGVVVAAAMLVIVILVVKGLRDKPSSRTEATDDTESSYYREETEEPETTTRETQGRDYYENGGYKGWDNYYIIHDLTTEDIIAMYEHYHDLAHTYELTELKNFDKELDHPCYSQVDVSGLGVYMFYDQILPDEKIDYVESFNVIGSESNGGIEFSMKIKIHDADKAMEIYDSFVERYSAGAQGSEFYNMLNTFDKGVRITVDESHDWLVCYKKLRDKYDCTYWIIYVSEDY